MTYSTSLSAMNGRLNFTADLAYDGQYTQIQQVYNGLGTQDIHASITEQAFAYLAGQKITSGGAIGNRQTISTLRFNAASPSWTLPAAWAHVFRVTAASIALRGRNLGLWTRYRGRDPGVNATPLGEELTDDGNVIPQPRDYALSIRFNW
jgi:hypothetical protein